VSAAVRVEQRFKLSHLHTSNKRVTQSYSIAAKELFSSKPKLAFGREKIGWACDKLGS
jgi:hypothetical protein